MNVSLQDVREALGELGKFRFGDMRVEDALHEIVHTTHAMFGVDGAGLMLSDAEQQLRSVAASDDRLQHLEEIQIQHSEGPCIAAFEDKELVGVEDLKQDLRWPKFSDAALSRRVRAVLATPLPAGASRAQEGLRHLRRGRGERRAPRLMSPSGSIPRPAEHHGPRPAICMRAELAHTGKCRRDAAQTPAVIRQSRFSPPRFSPISEGRRQLAAIGRDCTSCPKVTQEFE